MIFPGKPNQTRRTPGRYAGECGKRRTADHIRDEHPTAHVKRNTQATGTSSLNATRYSHLRPRPTRRKRLRPTTQQVDRSQGGTINCPSISGCQRTRNSPGSTRQIPTPFSRLHSCQIDPKAAPNSGEGMLGAILDSSIVRRSFFLSPPPGSTRSGHIRGVGPPDCCRPAQPRRPLHHGVFDHATVPVGPARDHTRKRIKEEHLVQSL